MKGQINILKVQGAMEITKVFFVRKLKKQQINMFRTNKLQKIASKTSAGVGEKVSDRRELVDGW